MSDWTLPKYGDEDFKDLLATELARPLVEVALRYGETIHEAAAHSVRSVVGMGIFPYLDEQWRALHWWQFGKRKAFIHEWADRAEKALKDAD